MGLPTLFFPMLRIERIALDEPRGSIPSLAEMFEKKSGPLAGGLSRAVCLVRCFRGCTTQIHEEPNSHGSQSAHVSAPGFPAIFHHCDSITSDYIWALGILIVAGFTDALDGLLARGLNQKTPLGAYLDPIADKLLLSSSYLVLALKGKIGVVAGDSGAGPRRAAAGGLRGDSDHGGLPAVSAQHLGEGHHVF